MEPTWISRLLYDWIKFFTVANKGDVMLVTFSSPQEFLEELSIDLKDRGAARGVVRCCYTIQRDPHIGFLNRYTLAAGFKNRDGDLVELLAYAGEAADGAKDDYDLRKIDQYRDKFLAQLKEVAPAVDVRSGRYRLGDGESSPALNYLERRVYFPWNYDGREGVASVSRHPDGKPTDHIGGG